MDYLICYFAQSDYQTKILLSYLRVGRQLCGTSARTMRTCSRPKAAKEEDANIQFIQEIRTILLLTVVR